MKSASIHIAALAATIACLSMQASSQGENATFSPTPSGGNTTSPSPSQGPPSPGYCYYSRVDIAGNDLDCGQTEYDGTPRPYCELRDLPYVEASCNLNDQCQAWTYDGYRAILKTAKGPMTYREGWSVFA